jgi:hypothetical protein
VLPCLRALMRCNDPGCLRAGVDWSEKRIVQTWIFGSSVRRTNRRRGYADGGASPVTLGGT